MNTRIQRHAVLGECLFADNGVVEIGIPLGYGIRIDPVAADSADRVLLHSASIRLKGSCDCWGLDLGAEWAPVSERWSGKILFTLKNLGSFGN